jgi:hypothetical protein
MEYWTEINLFADSAAQNEILLDVLWPYVRKLRKSGVLASFHYFREPEIRFRVRLKTERERRVQLGVQERMAKRLRERGLIRSWKFGSHGVEGEPYSGEEDRYGKNGWKVAQRYFEDGSETALRLLELKRELLLENPLWARGLGNPWEGGEKNPWRKREEDPLAYHWSRYMHLFSNQLGFDLDYEVRLCERQAEGYRKVVDEFGMKW